MLHTERVSVVGPILRAVADGSSTRGPARPTVFLVGLAALLAAAVTAVSVVEFTRVFFASSLPMPSLVVSHCIIGIFGHVCFYTTRPKGDVKLGADRLHIVVKSLTELLYE